MGRRRQAAGEGYRSFQDRLSACNDELKRAFTALDQAARSLPGVETFETSRGEGLRYKRGSAVVVRIDPKPRGWLGVNLPVPEADVLAALRHDLHDGRVRRRPIMSNEKRTWVDVLGWTEPMKERFATLIRLGCERSS